MTRLLAAGSSAESAGMKNPLYEGRETRRE
jgi:hypothetical protein